MIGADQVAGGVLVSGKLLPKVNCGPTTLSIECAHTQIESSRVDVRTNREVPTSANAGNLEIKSSVLLERCEVRRLHAVARIRIVNWRRQVALKDDGISLLAAHSEFGGWDGRDHKTTFRCTGKVAHLVHFDLIRGTGSDG